MLLVSLPALATKTSNLANSDYNEIGLRGVCWNWNESAKKSFGLTGPGCGVIAQEVRMLYPWVVLQGKGGYVRVQYDMLREMIYVISQQKFVAYHVETSCRSCFSLVFLAIS